MKNSIFKGLCVFFMLLSLSLALISPAMAQSGHGGSTEVIARIEPETTAATADTQPLPDSSGTSDGQPIQTGGTAVWLLISFTAMTGAFLLILGLKSGDSSDEKS